MTRGSDDAKEPGEADSAAPFLPRVEDLPHLRAAAEECRGCGLYRHATQVVFGAGGAGARVLLVGEQPGDQEDRRGEPFVGPAGRILDEALEAAGLDRGAVYVTNAVKHFSFEEVGKRRIHKTPKKREVAACRPWLDAEIRQVAPEVVVCLGATAAQALLGPKFRVTKERGRLLEPPGGLEAAGKVLATLHPSAVLRGREAREASFAMLVADLKVVAAHLATRSARGD